MIKLRTLIVAMALLGGLGAVPEVSWHAVDFVGMQDVFSRNLIGDAIVITAVHGTTDKIAIGNTYQIDGAYTLASHDSASLGADLTGTEPNEPHRQRVLGQSLTIYKGSGTFTLRLKVEDPGCPHVSFYPVDGGQSFGGEYFGTGSFIAPTHWQVAGQRPEPSVGLQ
jgi:hypothetical protein